MKFLSLVILLCTFGLSSFAADSRVAAVKNSPAINAVLNSLKLQGLSCVTFADEGGDESVFFGSESIDGAVVSTFEAAFVCSGNSRFNGKTAVFKGIIGDGGQTILLKYDFMWAN